MSVPNEDALEEDKKEKMEEDKTTYDEAKQDGGEEMAETAALEEKEPGKEPESEVDLLKSEIEDLKNQLAVARADLYNYRQRVERDRIRNRKLIVEDKILEFLPVLDNLDRALNVPEDGLAKDVLVGVRMVRRQFLSVLESSDVTVIPTEGCVFDPLLHEAVETKEIDDPSGDGAILCELLRGYRTPDRVLRPAQVRVARGTAS
jgi:molecular chaperone GrpE